MPQNARDLKNSMVFASQEVANSEMPLPWITPGDVLLRAPADGETRISGLERWVDDELERLGMLALTYRKTARHLVRHSIHQGQHPDDLVYVIGNLYRHALELQVKYLISRSVSFRTSDKKKQKERLNGHSLVALWEHARGEYAPVYDREEEATFSQLLADLDIIDEKSQGFRYLFTFEGKKGPRKDAGLLSENSFDNFVWVLDAMWSWAETLEDMKKQHDDAIRDMQTSLF